MSDAKDSKPTNDYSRTSSTDYVSARWCMLPPHVREAIVTLVDAGVKEQMATNLQDACPNEASQ